jgi:hypothetical protein
MNLSAISQAPSAALPSLRRLHWLLAGQSLVIVLASINRLSRFTLGHVAANEFLRWVDLLNMLVFPLVSVVLSYLVIKWLEAGRPASSGRALGLKLLFLVGVYLLAASYGDHEVTNYLHSRFCADDVTSDLCRIVIFNDDEFSHWVFFAGFTLVNGALLLLQEHWPWSGRLRGQDLALLVGNGLFIGAGIFANLAFEVIGLDLIVVVILAAMSGWLLWRRGRQPLFVYYAVAYAVGLAATAAVKALA